MRLHQKWNILLRKLGLKRKSEISTVEMESEQTQQASSYNSPADFSNLSEVAAPMPVQNQDENASTYVHHTLEESR